MARALLIRGAEQPLRILCVREFQNSLAQGVHRLLADQVEELQLAGFYRPCGKVNRIDGFYPDVRVRVPLLRRGCRCFRPALNSCVSPTKRTFPSTDEQHLAMKLLLSECA